MTFYFYDLETSGIRPREARIMQFAGQRTDENLRPIGDPHNILIKLAEDVVPDPDAIFITGITPQQTIMDGISEVAFLDIFHAEIATPDTVFIGFNTVRFDDEFMRFLHFRNFYDAYEWQYTDGKSRWDLLDLVRLTRALRPDGITWPVDEQGRPTNRLELLTSLNGITHEHAHDALSDVHASIAVARLIKERQPKLFEYLLAMRTKAAVEQLVSTKTPFVYASGKYAVEHQKTTIAVHVAAHPNRSGSLVYDLRHDPTPYIAMSADQLADAWRYNSDKSVARLPVKTLQYNKCPAVAPLSVLDAASRSRLDLDPQQARAYAALIAASDFADKLQAAARALDAEWLQKTAQGVDDSPDSRLYERFIGAGDKTKMRMVRAASETELASADIVFEDERLQLLLPLYKARNFPAALTDEERVIWEQYRTRRLLGGKQSSRLAQFFARLAELAAQTDITPEKQFILEELQLYGQSIMPVTDDV